MADAGEGHDEGIGASTLRLFVHESWTRPHDLGDGRHLRIVERNKDTGPTAQCFGKDVFSPVELVQDLVGRDEIPGGDGGVNLLPEGDEDVCGGWFRPIRIQMLVSTT